MNDERTQLRPSAVSLSEFQRWSSLGVLFLIGIVAATDRAIISVLLDPIKQEFAVSDTVLGLLSGAPFAVFYSIAGIPIASWADRTNRKSLLMGAMALWSGMTAMCGLATSIGTLLVARMGVGVGEAAAVPTTHSLIGDLFPPAQRSTAFALFTSSTAVGVMVALLGGAAITANYGWRAAFLCMGMLALPIIPIAMIFLREVRANAVREAPQEREGMMAAAKVLFAKPTFRNLTLGFTLYSLFAYGPMLSFIPLFLRRNGVEIGDIGFYYGLTTAIASLVGAICGGFLGDRLVRRNPVWMIRMPAIAILLTLPLAIGTFVVSGFPLFLAMFASLTIVIYGAVPTLFSAVQHLCGSRRRAMASLIVQGSLNLVGMSLGPLFTGMLSDAYSQHFGTEALRAAIITMAFWLAPAALFLFRASRTLHADAEA
jgi:predicted MFS family arabinose efflux permease